MDARCKSILSGFFLSSSSISWLSPLKPQTEYRETNGATTPNFRNPDLWSCWTWTVFGESLSGVVSMDEVVEVVLSSRLPLSTRKSFFVQDWGLPRWPLEFRHQHNRSGSLHPRS